MHINRQELMSSANRRARRARRTTGRILVSTLGFGLAYYFDTENGERRRAHLYGALAHAVRSIDSKLAPEAGEPPRVLTLLGRTLISDETFPTSSTSVREPIAAVR
jgi:hypothetical protein